MLCQLTIQKKKKETFFLLEVMEKKSCDNAFNRTVMITFLDGYF